MNSIEKLEQLRDAYLQSPPSGEALDLMVRQGLKMGEGLIREHVPEDPSDVDQLLERGAAFLLSLRSDDAPTTLEVAAVDEAIPQQLPAPVDA